VDRIDTELSPWQEGWLDLHHINTGRGDAAFYVFPDGTTMLVDAGELDPASERTNGPRNARARPNDSRPPFEWIARYVRQMSPREDLDYALLTHFHDDHMGALHSQAPLSSNGAYRLTGITGVGDLIPVRTLIDRDYPDYDYPVSIESELVETVVRQRPIIAPLVEDYRRTMANYRRFVAWQEAQNGMRVEQFAVGRSDQIALAHRPDGYDLEVRNVAANGRVWTGQGTAAQAHLPPAAELVPYALRLENLCSIAFRIRYGAFDYFNGADILGLVELDDPSWFDIETPVARAVGPTDVQVLNHHGYRNTHHEFFVRTTRPRVMVHQNWSSDQPGMGVLKRLTSTYLYPGPRDLFALEILQATRDYIGPAVDRAYTSMRGHIVVRAEPGGSRYWVVILDDTTESYRVTAVHGPYESH
jgi:hypothetical protein